MFHLQKATILPYFQYKKLMLTVQLLLAQAGMVISSPKHLSHHFHYIQNYTIKITYLYVQTASTPSFKLSLYKMEL